MPRYAELQVTSNYSFLRGASHIEELLVTAKTLDMAAAAITDRETWPGSRSRMPVHRTVSCQG